MRGPLAGAEIAETHISWVLLTGDRALKIYKPVRTDVLDHQDLERRRSACRREVELNRRLAPDVYEGLAEITLDGAALEPVIVMRRMPAERRLTALLGSDDATRCVEAVARQVAVFHAALPTLGEDEASTVASRAALEARWAEDLAGLRELTDDELAPTIDEIDGRAAAYLAGREPLLRSRIDLGMVVDGHGDLLADDIFCLDDGPRILDCLAFADRLRWGDVLADLGFLVMDLQRLGHPAAAQALLRTYCEYTAEHHPGSLAHLYVAQRALVRAKIAALRARQDESAAQAVTSLLGLVSDHLHRAEIDLVLVGGLPGSGKSTLSDELAARLGWSVVSSDEVRRDLGLRYRDLRDDRAYDAETVARVYEEMRRRAGQLLGMGVSVILDATWSSARERELARDLARRGVARMLEIESRAPLELCRERVARRSGGESEATPDVVDVLAAQTDRWPEAIPVQTPTGPITDPAVLAVGALWWHATRPTARRRSRTVGRER